MRAAWTSALLALAACSPDPRAWAGRIGSRSQLIGGPRALGEVGDYRLHNGKVRFIVQDKGASRGFGTFGGSLLDADLVRGAEGDPYSSNTPGKDGLAELFPAFFLNALEPDDVRVLDDGTGDGTSCGMPAGSSCVRVSGKASEFLTATKFIDQVTVGAGLAFAVDYKLGPNDDFLTITASLTNPSQFTHSFPIGQFPIPFGFIVLFGEGQPLFLDGEAGHDVRFALERSYKRPYQLPAFPGVTANVVATEGDGISYGLTYVPETPAGGYVWKHRDQYSQYGEVTPWSMLVPFVSGSFFGVYMAEAPTSLAGGATFSYTARLRVSEGSSSSVIDGLLRDTRQAVGSVGGVIREERSLSPLANAEVVIFRDGPAINGGFGPAVTSAKADAGGRFQALLPPGSYVAVGKLAPRPNAPPISFTVEAGKPTQLQPLVGRAALLAVDVTDENGRRIPAKVTVDASYGVEHANQDPKTFLYDFRLGDPYRPSDLVPDTDDPETRRYVESVFRAVNGTAQELVRPGQYRVTTSRGPAYTIDHQEVMLDPDVVTRVSARLRRVLPSAGRVAADLHVHSIASIDADVPFQDRVASYAAEGIDFLATTDHNYLVDLKPTVAQMGLEDFLQTTVGVELTTLEAGHWNAYPLNYQVGPIRHYDLDWFRKQPQEIFDGLRGLGRYGPDDTVVQVNHPRDSVQGYFTSYGLIGDPLNNVAAHDVPPRSGTFIPSGPGFENGSFSLDFDAVEILTGKRYDLMRTYRVPDPLPPPPIPANPGPPGSIVRDSTGAVAFPGAYDDWQHLLDSGHRVTAVGNSDSHHLVDGEGGYPRNLIDLGHGWAGAAQIDELEVARAIKAGRVLVTTAPEIKLTAIDPDAAAGAAELPVGSLVKPDRAGTVLVHVIVDAAPWVDVTHVALVLPGGKQIELPLDPPAADGVRRLDVQKRVNVPAGVDSWISAEASGLKSLYPVVVPFEIPPLLLNDAVNSVGSALGLKDEFGNLKPTLITRMTPFAASNPIFIDGDGDGRWGVPRTRQPHVAAKEQAQDARPRDLRALFREWNAR